MAKSLEDKSLKVLPGWKLCQTCYKLTQQDDNDDSFESEAEVMEMEINEDKDKDSDFEKEVTKKQKLDNSFDEMGISPIKLHGVAQHQRVASAKTKLKSCKPNT